MEELTPIAMKCTKEQFEAVRPKLIGLKITSISPFSDYIYLVNNLWGELKLISNIQDYAKGSHNRKVYEEWNEKTFLKACGIKTEPTLQHIEKEFDLSMCRVIVDNQEQSKKLQELAFKQGFSWRSKSKAIILTDKNVLYFNSKDYEITFSDLDYNDSNFKTFHFTDVFKEPLQEKEQRLLKELEEVRKEIEDSKIKVGDWVMHNNNYIFKVEKNKYDLDVLNESKEFKKITNQELIKLLEQGII